MNAILANATMPNTMGNTSINVLEAQTFWVLKIQWQELRMAWGLCLPGPGGALP